MRIRQVSALLCLLLLVADMAECGPRSTPDAGQRLDTVLSSYERVVLEPVDESALEDADPDRLAARDGPLPAHLTISALNRTFAVHLRRGQSVFTEDATVVVHGATPEETRRLDAAELRTNYVEGFLLGEPRSSVRGHVHDGAFFGAISVPGASYFVEPADTYFEGAGPLDAIVYEQDAVKIGQFCYADRNGTMFGTRPDTNGTLSDRNGSYEAGTQPRGGVTAAPDRTTGHRHPGPRGSGIPVRTGRACQVKVVADHFFHRNYGKSNVRSTVSRMELHVREADAMFAATDFDNDGSADGVRVRLAKAEVFQSPAERNYLLGDPGLNASAYLELFSMYEHEGFCAAMAFSQRVFANDVLGYAYRGAPNRTGGICTRRASVDGRMRSLNVGMTSFDYQGVAIPVARSTVVFAHELGHMFGSPHDEDSDGGACFLQDPNKHYIMSAIANPGRTATNRRFSSCSTKIMWENMRVHGWCLPCRGAECGAGLRPAPRQMAVVAAALAALGTWARSL